MFWDLESFFIVAAAFGEKTCAMPQSLLIVAAAFGAKTCGMPRVMGSLAGEELATQIQAGCFLIGLLTVWITLWACFHSNQTELTWWQAVQKLNQSRRKRGFPPLPLPMEQADQDAAKRLTTNLAFLNPEVYFP